MAPRLADSENIVFLFKCIESTGIKIDYGKVGIATGLNANTARMRYVRLRKAVESDLNSPRATSTSASSLQLPTTGTLSTPKKNTMKRKRKASPQEEDDDDSGVPGSNEKKAETLKSNDLNRPAKRQTRGVKLDFAIYNDDSDEDNGSGVTDGNDSSSDFQGESDTADMETTQQMSKQAAAISSPRPVKMVRLPLKYKEPVKKPTPSYVGCDQSRQVISTPTISEDEEAPDTFAALTPPETPTKSKVRTVRGAGHGQFAPPATKPDFDLSSLQSGKKVPSNIFKQEPARGNTQRGMTRRSTATPTRQTPSLSRTPIITRNDAAGGSSPSLQTALFRIPTCNIHRKDHNINSISDPSRHQNPELEAASAAADVHAESLTPDDSVSMIGEQHNHSPTTQQQITASAPAGSTLMERLSRFWK